MTAKKISQLDAATTAEDDDLFVIVHDGVSYKLTKENLAAALSIEQDQVVDLISDLAGKASTSHASTHAYDGSDPLVVQSGGIGSGQIGAFHLASGSVVSGSIASGQVGQYHLAQQSIVTTHVASGGLQSGGIGSGQISTNHIASGGLLSGAIGSGQISTFNIASGGLQSGAIGSGQINTNHIASGGLQSGAIGSGQVGTPHIASGAILATHIASGGLQSGGIGSGAIATFNIASGGLHPLSGAIASGGIGTNHIASGGLLSGAIGSGVVGFPHIASGAIISINMASGGLQSGGIGSGAIATFNIASGGLHPLSGAIASGGIGTIHIASGGLQSGAIGSGTIGIIHIASGGLQSGAIGSGTISFAQIASGQIIVDHIASGGLASGGVGSGAILSGNIASGQIGDAHLASGAVGVALSGGVYQWARDSIIVISEEAIASYSAVAIISGGTAVAATTNFDSNSSARWPAVGYTISGCLAGGQPVEVVLEGHAFIASGFAGRPVYLNQSGFVINASGLPPAGEYWQPIGFSLSGGAAAYIKPVLEKIGLPSDTTVFFADESIQPNRAVALTSGGLVTTANTDPNDPNVSGRWPAIGFTISGCGGLGQPVEVILEGYTFISGGKPANVPVYLDASGLVTTASGSPAFGSYWQPLGFTINNSGGVYIKPQLERKGTPFQTAMFIADENIQPNRAVALTSGGLVTTATTDISDTNSSGRWPAIGYTISGGSAGGAAVEVILEGYIVVSGATRQANTPVYLTASGLVAATSGSPKFGETWQPMGFTINGSGGIYIKPQMERIGMPFNTAMFISDESISPNRAVALTSGGLVTTATTDLDNPGNTSGRWPAIGYTISGCNSSFQSVEVILEGYTFISGSKPANIPVYLDASGFVTTTSGSPKAGEYWQPFGFTANNSGGVYIKPQMEKEGLPVTKTMFFSDESISPLQAVALTSGGLVITADINSSSPDRWPAIGYTMSGCSSLGQPVEVILNGYFNLSGSYPAGMPVYISYLSGGAVGRYPAFVEPGGYVQKMGFTINNSGGAYLKPEPTKIGLPTDIVTVISDQVISPFSPIAITLSGKAMPAYTSLMSGRLPAIGITISGSNDMSPVEIILEGYAQLSGGFAGQPIYVNSSGIIGNVSGGLIPGEYLQEIGFSLDTSGRSFIRPSLQKIGLPQTTTILYSSETIDPKSAVAISISGMAMFASSTMSGRLPAIGYTVSGCNSSFQPVEVVIDGYVLVSGGEFVAGRPIYVNASGSVGVLSGGRLSGGYGTDTSDAGAYLQPIGFVWTSGGIQIKPSLLIASGLYDGGPM